MAARTSIAVRGCSALWALSLRTGCVGNVAVMQCCVWFPRTHWKALEHWDADRSTFVSGTTHRRTHDHDIVHS